MWKKIACLTVVIGVVLIAYAQVQQTLTQSLFINSSDNFPVLKALKANQSNPWVEFSTGTTPTFQVTYPGSILTTATNTGSVTATGWTNGTGSDAVVFITGTAVAVTYYDNAGTAYLTNTTLVNALTTMFVQAGGKFTCASGLSGNWHTL